MLTPTKKLMLLLTIPVLVADQCTEGSCWPKRKKKEFTAEGNAFPNSSDLGVKQINNNSKKDLPNQDSEILPTQPLPIIGQSDALPDPDVPNHIDEVSNESESQTASTVNENSIEVGSIDDRSEAIKQSESPPPSQTPIKSSVFSSLKNFIAKKFKGN
ncbi:hypothetical protein [Cardinium endosymbiont of Nabis limbatus]|uniref:hypothetical protein n=1 Tax=Cardinium endosymbiont of Nabis limbatus TaxID=3066217 RepID=UPI003AF3A555